LPHLFRRVIVPSAVQEELRALGSPPIVHAWIARPPEWLEIMHPSGRGPERLDDGEAAVIALAESLHADLLLMDERKGVNTARGRGLRVTGTLGLLEMASHDLRLILSEKHFAESEPIVTHCV
jgi:predicted nucleic acid-binding protein